MPKEALADALDHPLIFLLVMAIGVASVLAILVWVFKSANMPGPAVLVGHP